MRKFGITVALLSALIIFGTATPARADDFGIGFSDGGFSIFFGSGHHGHHSYQTPYHGRHHHHPGCGHYPQRPVIIQPMPPVYQPPAYQPPAYQPPVYQRHCPPPVTVTVYETVTTRVWDRVWDSYSGCWRNVSRVVTRTIPREVTAYWNESCGSYGYYDSNGNFRLVTIR